jgi:hypothetical protein
MVYTLLYIMVCTGKYHLSFNGIYNDIYHLLYHGIKHGVHHDLTDAYHLDLTDAYATVTALDSMLAPTAPDRMLQLLHPISRHSTAEWLVF